MPGMPMIVEVPMGINKKKLAIRIASELFYVLGEKFLTEKEVNGLLCEASIRDKIGVSEEIIFMFEDVESTQSANLMIVK